MSQKTSETALPIVLACVVAVPMLVGLKACADHMSKPYCKFNDYVHCFNKVDKKGQTCEKCSGEIERAVRKEYYK